MRQTGCGQWIFNSTPLPMGGRSRSCPSSTSTPWNAWVLVERSVTADDLIGELDRLATQRGHPAVLRCDNGPELACAAMAEWAGTRVGLCFVPPGEPWRNGYVD